MQKYYKIEIMSGPAIHSSVRVPAFLEQSDLILSEALQGTCLGKWGGDAFLIDFKVAFVNALQRLSCTTDPEIIQQT